MFAISWLFFVVVLLCSTAPSTYAWLFARATTSTVSTVSSGVHATAFSALSPAHDVPDFDYEKAQAGSWCPWWQGQQYKGYVMHCGVDYFQGGDLFGEWAYNIDDCIAMCNNNPDCNFLSYQVETDNGSNGTCWLKSRPGIRRHDKTILGMFRVAARVPSVSPSASSEPSSTPSTILPPYNANGLSISTTSKSGSFSTSHTAVTTSSLQTISTFAATRSSSVTAAVEPAQIAAHDDSDGHSLAGPPSWFSEAHRCHPEECSTPITTYGKTLFLPPSITSPCQRIIVTKSFLTTQILSGSKTTITSTLTKINSSIGYSGASTIYLSGKGPTRISTYSFPLVSTEHIQPSSSRTYSKPHHMASSSKSYTVSSSASSSTTTEETSKHSPYSCAIITGRITCTGFNDAVSTKFIFTTTTLNPGTSTTTVYKTASVQSDAAVASDTYEVSRSTTSKTFVSGKPTVSILTGERTVTSNSNTTVTGTSSAIRKTVVSSESLSTKPVPAPIPTSTSGVATLTLTRWLTSKPTISSQITESSKSTASAFSSVASSSSKIGKSTAIVISNASTGVSISSKTIGGQWRDPSTWYVPTPMEQTRKQTASKSTRSTVTTGHYSHLESSSAATIKASSSGKTYPIPVYPPPSSKDILRMTSQGYVPTSFIPASASYTTISTARVSEVSSTPLQDGAPSSSSLTTSLQLTSPATPTETGPVTKSVNVSWSWTSTPKPSSDRSAGQHLVFSPSVQMAVVFTGSFILPFVAW